MYKYFVLFCFIYFLTISNCLEFEYYVTVNGGTSGSSSVSTSSSSASSGSSDSTVIGLVGDCGSTIDKSCGSIIAALASYNNTGTNSSDVITILMGDGEYGGMENTNLNGFGKTLIIKPINNSVVPSLVVFTGDNNNNSRVFNVIEQVPSSIAITDLEFVNINFKNFNLLGSSNGVGISDDKDSNYHLLSNEIGYGMGSVVYSLTTNSTFSLNFKNCNFHDNYAAKGGGIFYITNSRSNINSVTVGIVNSNFTSNSAGASGGVGYLNWFTLFTVDNCQFSNHSTPAGVASVLHLSNGGEFIAMNSNFANNLKSSVILIRSMDINKQNTIGYCNFDSNSIHGTGAAISMFSSRLTIESCTFTNNNAGSYGGAIYSYFLPSYLMIYNSQFINNSCSARGGAISLQDDVYTVIGNSTFQNNKAYSGGALSFEYLSGGVTLSNCEITSSNSVDQGGAIYTSYSKLTLTDGTTISNNVAKEGAAIFCSSSTLNITFIGSINGNSDFGNGTESYEYQDEDKIPLNDYNIYCSLYPTYTFCKVVGDAPYSEFCGEVDVTEHSALTGGKIAAIVVCSTIGAVVLTFSAAYLISKTTVAEHFQRLRSSSSSSTSYSLN